MRARRSALSVVAVAAAAVTVASLTPAKAATPQSLLTQLTGITGALPAVTGALDLGAAPATTQHFTLSLAYRNAAALKALDSSAHAPLTSAQFAATYGATPATIAAVTGWAKSAGLTVDSVAGNLVSLSGSTSTVATALGTAFHSFKAGTTTYTSVTQAVSLPSAIASLVSGIGGLSSLQSMSLPTLKPQAVTGTLPTFTPQDISDFYDATAAPSAAGQTNAVLASGDISQVKPDLDTFDATYGLPGPASYTVTQVGAASTDTSGQDEYDLDTQYATSQAPGAGIHVYDGPSLADADIASTVQAWVSADTEKSASLSVGGSELLSQLTGFTGTLDAILAQAVAQGQTLFVSSGDSGGYSSILINLGIPGGIPGVEYPSSSAYAVAVGGTTVLNAGNLGSTYTNEIAWYSGGGGISTAEKAPSWQSSLTGQRLVPDVALDADPTTGYDVVVSGAVEVIGGTSAGAPSWNGFWTRALAAGKSGFAAPKLYAASSTFHDIVIGTNGLFVATPGFDETTGLGTPDVAKLIAAI